MVRQGKDKKRRSGRTGRTKLKNRNYKTWNPKPSFTDPVIKKQWDPKKSYAQNMKKLGLVAHPGAVVTTKDAEQNQQQSTVIELYDVPHSDTLEARKKKRPQSADDQKYIARLLAKYGDDYTAMFRDIKVNKMQYTETQLRKMASRFFLLDEEQRVVDVPERIKATSVSGN
jgi:nucleolar protein 16